MDTLKAALMLWKVRSPLLLGRQGPTVALGSKARSSSTLRCFIIVLVAIPTFGNWRLWYSRKSLLAINYGFVKQGEIDTNTSDFCAPRPQR